MKRSGLFLLLFPVVVAVAGLGVEAQQTSEHRGYRHVTPQEVKLTALQPAGWEIRLPGVKADAMQARSFAAGRLRSFTNLYLRDNRLVALGTTGAGEGGLVLDVQTGCQALGFLGLGLTPSPDGRYIAFSQYETRSDAPNGLVLRIVDIDAAQCAAPQADTDAAWKADWSNAVAAGEIILPAGATDPKPASNFESRSPLAWVSGSVVMVVRDSKTDTILLSRYEPASRRLATRVLDWNGIVGPNSARERPADHVTASISFSEIVPVVEKGEIFVRLRLANEYRHRAKWVDIDLPDFSDAR
jgi:hypothetical protein